MELFVNITVPGINAAIADHFIMLFGDMLYEAPDELHSRNGFLYILPIFMAVVVEGDRFTVILVNPGSGDDGAPKVTPDVFYNSFRVTFVRLGIDIETFLVLPVTVGFNFFKGWPNHGFHFVKQGSTEGIAKESIVKMPDIAPETVVAVAAFRNEAVDMGVPFQVPAKGVEYHDKAGSEVQGLILLEEHAGNDTGYSVKQAVKEGAVIQEEIPELFVNGENTVAVRDIDEFKGHGGSALHGV